MIETPIMTLVAFTQKDLDLLLAALNLEAQDVAFTVENLTIVFEEEPLFDYFKIFDNCGAKFIYEY